MPLDRGGGSDGWSVRRTTEPAPSAPTSRSPSATSPSAMCSATSPAGTVNPWLRCERHCVLPTASSRAPCSAGRSAITVGPPSASGGETPRASGQCRPCDAARRASARMPEPRPRRPRRVRAAPRLHSARSKPEAEFTRRHCAFEDADIPPRLPQGDAGRQATDAGADDQGGPHHRSTNALPESKPTFSCSFRNSVPQDGQDPESSLREDRQRQ